MPTITTSCALLLAAAAVMVPASPATAVGDAEAASTVACVSDEQYEQLGIGQRLREVRGIVGDQAQVGPVRRWSSGADTYQERLYAMCTPYDDAHDTLTVRFMRWEGAWRAQIVDTLVGPEPNCRPRPRFAYAHVARDTRHIPLVNEGGPTWT
jgi:hypothetical protein